MLSIVYLIAPQATGDIGAYQATFDSQVASALPRTFNNSCYFVRNGSKIRTSFYKTDGYAEGNGAPREPWEVYKDNIIFWGGETKGINKQYEGCQSLYHFIETFYNDILSFQYNRDNITRGLRSFHSPELQSTSRCVLRVTVLSYL